MPKTRSYKLLCPIARALDRIGDRWTLLILRDLHAGPARYSELQQGLTGIAANLLTDRLNKLVADGLVQRADGRHGAKVYELTELGLKTGGLIFDLALFGARFRPEAEIVAPGNLRTVATTLGAAAARVQAPQMDFRAALIVDGEAIDLRALGGAVSVTYGPTRDPDVTLSTSYEAMLGASEGEMPIEAFMAACQIDVAVPEAGQAFARLMTDIITLLREND